MRALRRRLQAGRLGCWGCQKAQASRRSPRSSSSQRRICASQAVCIPPGCSLTLTSSCCLPLSSSSSSRSRSRSRSRNLFSVQTLVASVNTRADEDCCAGGWGAGVPVPAQPGARDSRRGVPQQLVLHAPGRRGGRRSAKEQPCVLPSEVPQQVSMWPPEPSDSWHAFNAAGALHKCSPCLQSCSSVPSCGHLASTASPDKLARIIS